MIRSMDWSQAARKAAFWICTREMKPPPPLTMGRCRRALSTSVTSSILMPSRFLATVPRMMLSHSWLASPTKRAGTTRLRWKGRGWMAPRSTAAWFWTDRSPKAVVRTVADRSVALSSSCVFTHSSLPRGVPMRRSPSFGSMMVTPGGKSSLCAAVRSSGNHTSILPGASVWPASVAYIPVGSPISRMIWAAPSTVVPPPVSSTKWTMVLSGLFALRQSDAAHTAAPKTTGEKG